MASVLRAGHGTLESEKSISLTLVSVNAAFIVLKIQCAKLIVQAHTAQ